MSRRGKQAVADDGKQRRLIKPCANHDFPDRADIVPIVLRAETKRFFVDAGDFDQQPVEGFGPVRGLSIEHIHRGLLGSGDVVGEKLGKRWGRRMIGIPQIADD